MKYLESTVCCVGSDGNGGHDIISVLCKPGCGRRLRAAGKDTGTVVATVQETDGSLDWDSGGRVGIGQGFKNIRR